MWPKFVDYTKEECKQMLRRLELEAYSSVVNALRAQGEFNQAKAKILQDLSNMLSITLERHQAEIRRAVNDERLSTIAFHVSGEEFSNEWASEGRRLIPLMPRLIPQSQLTNIASRSATQQLAKNDTLPMPSSTGFKILHNLKEQKQTVNRETNLLTASSTSTSIIPPSSSSSPSPSPSSSSSPLSSSLIATTAPTAKRPRLDSGSSTSSFTTSLTSPKGKTYLPTSSLPITGKTSVNLITKSGAVISTCRTNIQLPSTYTVSSSAPRVVFMSSNGTGTRTLTVNDVNASAALLTAGANGTTSAITKARVVQGTNIEPSAIIGTAKRIIKTSAKALTGTNNSSIASTVTLAPGTRIIPAKGATFPQQVVVFPSGSQQKTITIPIAQPIKVPSVPGSSNNTAVVYQTSASTNSQAAGTIKAALPGTITIQTFKPSPALIAISQ